MVGAVEKPIGDVKTAWWPDFHDSPYMVRTNLYTSCASTQKNRPGDFFFTTALDFDFAVLSVSGVL